MLWEMREDAKILIGAMSGAAQQTATEKLSFDEAFTLHNRTVFRVARNLVSDSGLAEDVTQEVFLRLYKNMDAIKDNEMLRPWLIRVALNVARNTIRGASRAAKREDNFVQDFDNQYLTTFDAEIDYERQEQINEVRKALEKVKEPMRSCLLLKQEGLSYKEIALALSLNETSIGTFVARGRKEFVRFFGKIGKTE